MSTLIQFIYLPKTIYILPQLMYQKAFQYSCKWKDVTLKNNSDRRWINRRRYLMSIWRSFLLDSSNFLFFFDFHPFSDVCLLNKRMTFFVVDFFKVAASILDIKCIFISNWSIQISYVHTYSHKCRFFMDGTWCSLLLHEFERKSIIWAFI